MRHQSPVDHRSVASRLRAQPGVWLPVGEYRNSISADGVARYIRTAFVNKPGAIGRWYRPAGAYESRTSLTEDGTLVEARYVGPVGGAA
ncbi:hypothetical protein ABZX85_23100 [Streptomyces sp. NPDC004539]|uniref:hypothetical protein n=1 Tax=Streptomyces sp. NPDC004539 TaxID=3154280 RepID=UPI0033AB38EA